MPSNVEVQSLEKLKEMHTGTLMSRREALLKCEESLDMSDRDFPITDPNIIEFKDSHEWQQAYKDVKSILATREHVPSKGERKTIRLAKAKAK